jgi:hypothetical protein
MKRGKACVLMAVVLWIAPAGARADTRPEYMRRLALLLDWSHRGVGWVESNIEDRALGRAAQAIAERYVEVAGRMLPPAELRALHPHVILIVENAERACHFASVANMRDFNHHVRILREEERILLEFLRTSHIELPRM